MTTYRLLLVLKFAGVLGYAGGLGAAFVAGAPRDRRRAVHLVASPALLLVWLAGYGLAAMLGVALTELWILGGLLLSFASLLVLIGTAGREVRTPATALAATLPLVAVLFLMAFRPTWSR